MREEGGVRGAGGRREWGCVRGVALAAGGAGAASLVGCARPRAGAADHPASLVRVASRGRRLAAASAAAPMLAAAARRAGGAAAGCSSRVVLHTRGFASGHRRPPTTDPAADGLTAAATLWPPTRHQAKAGARTLAALRAVLANPGAAGLAPGLHARLVSAGGFAPAAARASPDGATVHVAYECAPGRERDVEAALSGGAGRLRVAVARALGARRVPVLRFALDAPCEGQAAVFAELDRLAREEGGGRGGGTG